VARVIPILAPLRLPKRAPESCDCSSRYRVSDIDGITRQGVGPHTGPVGYVSRALEVVAHFWLAVKL